MKTAKLSCGCRYQVGDIERWIELCPPHKDEADAIHARWAEEHRASQARYNEPHAAPQANRR